MFWGFFTVEKVAYNTECFGPSCSAKNGKSMKLFRCFFQTSDWDITLISFELKDAT